jgi:hypothetical protein
MEQNVTPPTPQFPIGIRPRASLICRDFLDRLLVQEAKDNGFETREEYLKWKYSK